MTQTEQQNVPALRFPGFEGEWFLEKLGTHVSILSGNSPSKFALKEDGEVPFIKVEDLNNCEKYQESSRTYTSTRKGSAPKNSVVFPKRGAAIMNNKVRISRVPVQMDSNLMAVSTNEETLDPEFLYYEIVRVELHRIADTSTIPQLNNKHITPLKINFPTLPEQRKIVGFLGAVDERIAQVTRKKALLEDYKKGCMQQLFSQSIRFKDDQGNDFPDWEEKPLHAFLTETKKKSDRTEPVFSVSVHKGLIDQIEHLGRSFSADDTGHYNRVEPGDVVYTKSPTGDFPLGIIKQSRLDKPVIVSPLYGVFRPETADLGYLLHVYFESHINTENYLKPIIQKGAKNTINITNKTFLSAKLKVPTHPGEQRKIANFLKAIDTNINLVAQELGHAQTFKKGLLQQMFV